MYWYENFICELLKNNQQKKKNDLKNDRDVELVLYSSHSLHPVVWSLDRSALTADQAGAVTYCLIALFQGCNGIRCK